jgi:hypothetical protein
LQIIAKLVKWQLGIYKNFPHSIILEQSSNHFSVYTSCNTNGCLLHISKPLGKKSHPLELPKHLISHYFGFQPLQPAKIFHPQACYSKNPNCYGKCHNKYIFTINQNPLRLVQDTKFWLVHMHEQNDQETCSLHNENHDIHLSQSTLPMVEFKGWPSIQFQDDNFIELCC